MNLTTTLSLQLAVVAAFVAGCAFQIPTDTDEVRLAGFECAADLDCGVFAHCVTGELWCAESACYGTLADLTCAQDVTGTGPTLGCGPADPPRAQTHPDMERCGGPSSCRRVNPSSLTSERSLRPWANVVGPEGSRAILGAIRVWGLRHGAWSEIGGSGWTWNERIPDSANWSCAFVNKVDLPYLGDSSSAHVTLASSREIRHLGGSFDLDADYADVRVTIEVLETTAGAIVQAGVDVWNGPHRETELAVSGWVSAARCTGSLTLATPAQADPGNCSPPVGSGTLAPAPAIQLVGVPATVEIGQTYPVCWTSTVTPVFVRLAAPGGSFDLLPAGGDPRASNCTNYEVFTNQGLGPARLIATAGSARAEIAFTITNPAPAPAPDDQLVVDMGPTITSRCGGLVQTLAWPAGSEIASPPGEPLRLDVTGRTGGLHLGARCVRGYVAWPVGATASEAGIASIRLRGRDITRCVTIVPDTFGAKPLVNLNAAYPDC